MTAIDNAHSVLDIYSRIAAGEIVSFKDWLAGFGAIVGLVVLLMNIISTIRFACTGGRKGFALTRAVLRGVASLFASRCPEGPARVAVEALAGSGVKLRRNVPQCGSDAKCSKYDVVEAGNLSVYLDDEHFGLGFSKVESGGVDQCHLLSPHELRWIIWAARQARTKYLHNERQTGRDLFSESIRTVAAVASQVKKEHVNDADMLAVAQDTLAKMREINKELRDELRGLRGGQNAGDCNNQPVGARRTA